VNFDGEGDHRVETGDRIVVRMSRKGTNIIKISNLSFLEVLRKDPNFILRERIVTYATKISDVRVVAKHPCAAPRVSAKKDTKAKISKTTVVR